MKNPAMMVNITWNKEKWRGININDKAGHELVRNAAGHESLNFDFNKKGIDGETWVYGYFQTHKKPVNFEDGGLIFFYSKDIDTGENFLVGVYGYAEVLDKKTYPNYDLYGRNEYWTNIRGKRKVSLIFSRYLSLNKIPIKKRMGRVGYVYLDNDDSSAILDYAIKQCEEGSDDRLVRLKSMCESLDQKDYNMPYEDLLMEQNREERVLAQEMKKRGNLKKPKESSPAYTESIKISVTHYPRSSQLSAFMKHKNNHTCQVCEVPTFQTNQGMYYTESHHVLPRSKGGEDKSENIVIVCSNCHKLFHNGDENERIAAYSTLKKKRAFMDFDVLKEKYVITANIYNAIMNS